MGINYCHASVVVSGGTSERSRSQGRPQGAAAAGIPLDGAESGGKFRCLSIVQSWITERPGINRKWRTFRVATE